jgi:hypothetical protein
MPGAAGDPVKAVQNLPGIAHVSGFSSQVVIQGSAPQDTSYLFDDHEVPLIFHFGGLTSVVTPEAVSGVDYLAAGYGPTYGRAQGGLIDLHMRDPATDRTKGFFFVDTMKSGGLVEGPIDDKSSFLVTGRYSYLGFLLQAVLQNNGQFDLTVAPAFGDFGAIYKLKPSASDEVRVVAIASRDQLGFLFNEPSRTDPGIRGTFNDETDFFRLIPQWTRKADGGVAYKASLGLGRDIVQINTGDDYFNVASSVATQRAEVEAPLSPSWKAALGMDNRMSLSRASVNLPLTYGAGGVSNPFSTGSTVNETVEKDAFYGALFFRNEIRAPGSPWTFMPSLRVDYFSDTKELLPAPRLAGRYALDDTAFLKAATGYYYQPPQPQENSEGVGNPSLTAPWAWHITVGAEKDARSQTGTGFQVSGSLFYRDFENQVIPTQALVNQGGALAPEYYSNEGTGVAYGAETLIRYDKKPWSGWLAYTLSRSLRTEPTAGEHLFQYDQTHNLNLIVAYEEKNWKYSGRARYVTGDPTTPVASATFDADNDVYIPARGALYSTRLDPFFQVDVRIDKKWIFDRSIWSAYLDVQNATNRKNPEGIRYSYNYSQSQVVSDLPILPTLGVRGDF